MSEQNPPPTLGWPISPRPWRTGRKVFRTIYDANEKLIGVMDSPEDALAVVTAVNAQGATP